MNSFIHPNKRIEKWK